jgi:predicted protein tyrosine phosphatase
MTPRAPTLLRSDSSPVQASIPKLRLESRHQAWEVVRPPRETRTALVDAAVARSYVTDMKPISLSMLTVCGLEELTLHGSRGVTHVLSILDPDHPEPEAFDAYDRHHRTILRFHDAIEPATDIVLPRQQDVEGILEFGRLLANPIEGDVERHLLVHCHAGISRSTAAMAMLMAQLHPDHNEDEIFDRLLELRPKAWPNSLMIGFADQQLSMEGRLTRAVAKLYRRQLSAFPNIGLYMRENGRAREVEMAMQAQPT